MAVVTIKEKNLIAAERTGSKILTASKEFKSLNEKQKLALS